MDHISRIPLKTMGGGIVTVADVGEAKDAQQIQTNVVRVDGQPSVYLPVLKQGGETNTISVVEGIVGVKKLVDVPEQLVANVVFDQSIYVKKAIETLLHEGAWACLMTAMMILVFLGAFARRSRFAFRFRFQFWLLLWLFPSAAGRSIRWRSADWRWSCRG